MNEECTQLSSKVILFPGKRIKAMEETHIIHGIKRSNFTSGRLEVSGIEKDPLKGRSGYTYRFILSLPKAPQELGRDKCLTECYTISNDRIHLTASSSLKTASKQLSLKTIVKSVISKLKNSIRKLRKLLFK